MPAVLAARMLSLSPADPATWDWWPTLVKRITHSLPAVAPEVPITPFLKFLVEMATHVPHSVRWWVALEGEAVVGHAIGWVDVSWEQPYLLIHQVAADQGARDLMEDWLASVGDWGRDVNARYAEAGSPLRVSEVRFWSARGDASWDRLLRGRVSQTFHVKHVPLERL